MLAQRIIFDTSTVVAGLREPVASQNVLRAASELLSWWRGAELRGVVSDFLIAEYEDVLARPEHFIPSADRTELLNVARDRERSEHFVLMPPFERVSKDPDDDHLVALAKKSRADFLCTEDVAGLLELHIVGDTVIINTRVMHAKLRVDLEIDRAVQASAGPGNARKS